jgi:hypothetical protein
MDCDRLEEIFSEMNDYRVAGSEEEKWKQLKAAAEQFDYGKIIEVLGK